MTQLASSRSTLPERFFPLGDPTAVDALLDGFEWAVVFKAATNERTFEAWFLVQQAIEPRVDVAVGLIQIPAGRSASDHVATRSGVAHKSPQFLVFHHAQALGHLDERNIHAEALAGLLGTHLPATIGPRVVNPRAVSFDGYRTLLSEFVAGRLPAERFEWAYLDRLAREAAWRDDESFALLTSLFDYPWARDFVPARVVAHEFQGQLAGRLGALSERASRVLARLDALAADEAR